MVMGDTKINKFQNISILCRACLSSKDIEPLCNSELCIIYEKITDLKIQTYNNLPLNICIKCSKTLDDISKFIQTCKLSDEYLKNALDDSLLNEDDSCSIQENEDTPDNLQKKDSIPVDEQNSNSISKVKMKHTEKYACDICDKQFSTASLLERHQKVHLGIKPFECHKCGMKFSQKSTLQRHCLTHTEHKPFECNLCGKRATRKIKVIEHIQKYHSNVSQEDYDKIITKHEFNSSHNKKAIEDILSLSSPNVEIKFEDGDIESSESEHQNLTTKSELIVSDNISEVKIVQEIGKDAKEVESEVSGNDSENDETKMDEGNPAKKKRLEICLCSLCGKIFKRNEYLRNHMAIHMNVKPYSCNICGAGFTQRQALTRHNLVHTKERPYKCTHCDKTFTRKEKMTDHIRCHEEGVDPHLCFHCGKRFKDREYLRKHLQYFLKGGKTRWRQKPRRCLCPECGKEFNSETYLKVHLRTHSGERPYNCEPCNKTFSVKAALVYHMQIHNGLKPFRCMDTQCNKSFRTFTALKIHERMHSGERPYICEVCNKGFIRSGHLKRHLKLHQPNNKPSGTESNDS